MTSASAAVTAPARPAPRSPARRWRWAPWLIGLAALAVYVLPGLGAPGRHWPLWNVQVYWWGGQQAEHGAALFGPAAPVSFTYPPFAAWLFAGVPIGVLKADLVVASLVALTLLTWQAMTAAGIRPRAGAVFATTALALLTWPVAYTLHLGEVNLILAALIGSDLLRRRDGGRWQGAATGVAAGIKLTPLIFVVYLLVTGRIRAAFTALGTFVGTVALGWVLLPASSRMFWLGGVFDNPHRVGDQANPADQSMAGALARLAGQHAAPRAGWLAVAAVTGLAGLAVAAWAHRRGHRLGGVVCCAMTGLLISPMSWTHHWVWVVPLMVWLTAVAWRRRSWLGLAGVAATAAVFSGQLPMPWAGPASGPGRLMAGDLWVLYALVMLAGTALSLLRAPRRWAGVPLLPPPADAGRRRGWIPGRLAARSTRRPGP